MDRTTVSILIYVLWYRLMYILIIISLIFFGLVFGSFGSVIFYRLWDWPTKETWKWFLVWRSECPKCHHQLKARNLVPIFSWLFQWWKCEYCKAPISRFYPFLEITSVIIFVWVFFILSEYRIPWHHIWLWEGYIYTIFIIISAWLLRLILLYDIKTYELHITATVFLAIITLFFTLFFWNNRLSILLWMLIITIIFVLIYYLWMFVATLKFKIKSEWFWLWDIILAPILWAWLVFFIQPSWIYEWCYLFNFFIILSWIVGLFYFLWDFIIRKIISLKKKKKTKRLPFLWNTWLPFFPSIITATVLEIVFWEQLVYYWNLFWDFLINLLFL